MPVSLGGFGETREHERRRLPRRLGIVAGFATVLALLVGNTFIVTNQLRVQKANQKWLIHSRLVLFQLERTESLLKDAETGQRGFLYTGEPKYLEPYNLAAGQVQPNTDEIAKLTADNPDQQARIPALRSLAQAKLAELAQTIALDRAGKKNEAKALVTSDAGKVAMDNIRSLIAVMEREETALEGSRTIAVQKSIRATILAVYLPSLVAVLGLGLLAFVILQQFDRNEKSLHEIRKREEWFRVTLTSIGDAVIATNEQGKVTFLNPVAEALTGTTQAQAIGKDIVEVFPIFNEITREVAENPVQKVMAQGHVVGLANHTVLKCADGTLIPIEDSGSPIWDDRSKLVGVALIFRDATRERKSREVLIKTERLAAAARLSASVAHEINNPLASVVNLIYLAKSTPDVPHSVIDLLAVAEQELDRVAHVVRQTLGFYRDSSAPVLVEIPALIESVLQIYSNKIKNKNIAIKRDLCQCPPVLGMPGELRQVLSNLISNAMDAVGNDGTITLRSFCVDEAAGKAIHLVVEDDGPGVAANDREQIFEPFFTTKMDVGTGLGLWVSREIVERFGGKIEVNSRDDGSSGAAFSILLPCSTEVVPV